MVICDECEGEGYAPADIDESSPLYVEFTELENDIKRVNEQARRLSLLKPDLKDVYAAQAERLVRDLEKKADATARALVEGGTELERREREIHERSRLLFSESIPQPKPEGGP